MKHEMTFLRIATEAKDGFKGLLYRHSWGSGYQDIIFTTQRAAHDFMFSIDPSAKCDPDNNAGEAIELSALNN